MRLTEIVTEPINLSGLKADEEKEVRINLGGGTVWLEDTSPVKVLVRVEPEGGEPEADEVEGSAVAEPVSES